MISLRYKESTMKNVQYKWSSLNRQWTMNRVQHNCSINQQWTIHDIIAFYWLNNEPCPNKTEALQISDKQFLICFEELKINNE
jgi:hypothetical protein